jgi:hypothetical protein
MAPPVYSRLSSSAGSGDSRMYVEMRSLSACSFQYPLVKKEAVVFQDIERIWAHAAKFNCPPVLSQEKYREIDMVTCIGTFHT